MSEIDRWGEDRLMPDSTREELSPSGRYRLLLRYYDQGKGYWSYSRGTVYRVSDGELVCDIKRNYSSFFNDFLEKDGQEWLISGRSYMGQTIVNLDTAKEYEHKGQFCWTRTHLSPDQNLLLVEGCYWAAPYEIKAFDFRDPSQGWPEIPFASLKAYEAAKGAPKEMNTLSVYLDARPPEFEGDRITTYSTDGIFIPTGQREDDITGDEMDVIGEAYDDESNWRREIDIRSVFERREGALVRIEEWRSDYQREKDRKNAEWRAADKVRKEEWMLRDPFFPQTKGPLTEGLLVEQWWSHPSVNDREGGEKNPAFFYLSLKLESSSKRHAYLKWGVFEGPVVAELWMYGKGSSPETFDRSQEGLVRAVGAIRAHLKGE